MMASISAVAVMVTYCWDFMNRNSATRKSEAAHSPGFCPLPALCIAALMAARMQALLMPPRPDMNDQLRHRAVHFAANELEEGH